MDKVPNRVDVQVGARLRAVRKFKGRTQNEVGAAIGVSFQQLQKYERGTNRISASALVGVATFLGTPVEVFFEGIMPAPGQNAAIGETFIQFAGEAGALELSELFLGMHPRHRAAVLECARAFSHAIAA